MRHIETDYLVVGAGASGMAFTDVLLTETNHKVLLVDRRSDPGGHWVDAYPFVQLHQPSAYYGVNSLPLGSDQIDSTGINAGFYERAGASELKHYYKCVLDEVFRPSGRVEFKGSTEYLRQEEGKHIIRSNLTGEQIAIEVRRAIVDATVTESSIPLRHTPRFHVDPEVRLVTPNSLADVVAPSGFTILGAGKTSMDVCYWLLEQGVPPEKITWVRPRESWMTERSYTQPLSLAANMVKMQAMTIKSAAEASSPADYAMRMAEQGAFVRLDPSKEAQVNRGATISLQELSALQRIENVIRRGHVRSITPSRMSFDDGDVPTASNQVYVDCTAQGLSTRTGEKIFYDKRIDLHFTTLGVAPWSAAVVAFVESLELPLEQKNKLCPPLPRTGDIRGVLNIMRVGLPAEMERRTIAEIAAWSGRSRLNPGRSIADHMDQPDVQKAFGIMMNNYEPARANLDRICAMETA